MRIILFLLLSTSFLFSQNIPVTSIRATDAPNKVIRSGVNGRPEWVSDSIYFSKYFNVASAPLTAKKGDVWRSTANQNTYLWDGIDWRLIAKKDTLSIPDVFLGTNAGLSNSATGAVGIGVGAGRNNQSNNTVHIGFEAGLNANPSSVNSINLGVWAGRSSTGASTINLGSEAGQFNAAENVINIGRGAGYTNNFTEVINVGLRAGFNNRNQRVINLGYEAGHENKSYIGINIGANAGYNSQGNFPINMGYEAGYNQNGSTNINIGFQAARSLVGFENIAIGANSMGESTSSNLIAIGNQAARSSNQNGGIMIGAFAGQGNDAIDPILIGFRAGQSNKSLRAIFIGTEAGLNSEGPNHIGIGQNTLKSTTTAFENVAIGNDAFAALTTGSRSVAIGVGAGQANQTGGENTYVGWRAGFVNNGSRNTLIGESANDQSINAVSNSGVGAEVMHDNRDSEFNVAIGEYALYQLQTYPVVPSTNLTVGDTYEIFGIGTTDFTALGAANNLTYTQFVYNGAATSGTGRVRCITKKANRNVAIGSSSGHTVGEGNGNIYIGDNAGNNEAFRNKSNQLVIHNTATDNPLIGGNFLTRELKIGGVQQFTVQYATSGTGVPNGSMFYGTNGALYFKGGSGTVTQIAAP
jgi:hypothetical protein